MSLVSWLRLLSYLDDGPVEITQLAIQFLDFRTKREIHNAESTLLRDGSAPPRSGWVGSGHFGVGAWTVSRYLCKGPRVEFRVWCRPEI